MANKYRYCGEAFHWDYSGYGAGFAGMTGIELPMQGGSASQYTPIISGDQGQTIDGNYFTDTDANLFLVVEIFFYPAPGDIYPIYTGYGGARRQVIFNLQFDYYASPFVSLMGIGSVRSTVWVHLKYVFNMKYHLSTYWPSKLGRFIPTYYDNGISGEKAVVNGIRGFWYHYI